MYLCWLIRFKLIKLHDENEVCMYNILSIIGTAHNDQESLVPLFNCFAVEDEQAAACFTEENANLIFYFSKTGL